MDVAAALAIRFNERINAGDLEGLARMMSADHTFVDTAGTVPNPAAPQLAAPRAAVGLAGSPPTPSRNVVCPASERHSTV